MSGSQEYTYKYPISDSNNFIKNFKGNPSKYFYSQKGAYRSYKFVRYRWFERKKKTVR